MTLSFSQEWGFPFLRFTRKVSCVFSVQKFWLVNQPWLDFSFPPYTHTKFSSNAGGLLFDSLPWLIFLLFWRAAAKVCLSPRLLENTVIPSETLGWDTLASQGTVTLLAQAAPHSLSPLAWCWVELFPKVLCFQTCMGGGGLEGRCFPWWLLLCKQFSESSWTFLSWRFLKFLSGCFMYVWTSFW